MIIVNGVKGKARPRFNMKSGVAYTPNGTKDFEKLIARTWLEEDKRFFGAGVPLQLNLRIFQKVPTVMNKRKVTKDDKVQMLRGIFKPTKKPDIDNIIKIVLDSLNGVAFADDIQIVSVKASKDFADSDFLEIELKHIGGEF